MVPHWQPTLHAVLNASAMTLLIFGYFQIRRGRRELHRRAMLAAFACSTAFLVSYLHYHANVGSVRFQGTGAIRAFYLGVLLTHTVLAAAVPFLAATTLYRAWRAEKGAGDFSSHRRLARWTLPIWIYVSLTGVVIYLMLYHF